MPFFKKIYFREASFAKKKSFFKEKLNKTFFQFGLKDLSGKFMNRSFVLKKFLTKRYIKNNFKTEFFNNFAELNKIEDKDTKKIIYALENYIYLTDVLAIDSSSYVAIKFFYPNSIVYYFPSSKKSYLAMTEIRNEKLRIIGSIVLIDEFFSIFKKIITTTRNTIFFFSNNSIKKNIITKNKDVNNNSCEVGFFPHAGLKYGNFFKKTFFYNNSIQSKLYKNNIDTISFQEFDKLSARFLKFFKLMNTQINDFSNKISIKSLFSYITFFYKNVRLIKKNKLMNFIILLEIFLSIRKYNKFFKTKKYKFLIFYNDFLIPPAMLLAASINRIKTISIQDRLTSYIYYHRCFFDLYLIAGNEFKNIFDNKYMITNYQTLGLTRSNLIKQEKAFTLKNIKNYKKNQELITCLLLGHRSDWNDNLNGQDGASSNAILNFCHDIKKLSDIFKDRFFIIKCKDIKSITANTELLTSMNKIIVKSNNLTLLTDDNISSTKLIAHSILSIGKYSTIMDEALVADKNILLHDTENFVSTFGYYRKNKFLITTDFEELLMKTKSLLERNNHFYKNYIKLKKNYVNNYLTDNGAIGSPQKIVEIIEKYIKNIN